MIIEPNVRGFICTTAHPMGCMEHVKRQIAYIKENGKVAGPKKVLIIGSSTGYGLASRIAATYASDAATIGIMFDKPATQRRTATPGFYNTAAFEFLAKSDGYYAKSINGDAFSREIKEQTIDLIKKDLGKIDMVIYSLASPRRTTNDGTTYQSTLKTTSSDFTNKSLNLRNNTITQATITPATKDEITSTIKVMGGEDWKDWISCLWEAGVLEENSTTIAYSYIGPKLTNPVYYNGTIGMAKKHLYDTSREITNEYKAGNIKAYISVNKALVTQASSAIPIVPLYFAILYKVMKEMGNHEGCIEQMNRLFHDKLVGDTPVVDDKNQIRLDDYEMQEEVQAEVMRRWERVSTENVNEVADLAGYWEDFYRMFGFHFENVNYSEDIDISATPIYKIK